jgi:glycosyltransferase involved in cell wall biosynthesis
MGWDYKRKGVDLAIKATHALQKKYNLTLQILGGVNEDKIKRLANEILGKDVDWIRYLPPTNNVGTYYTKNDIFLSPSRQEAFGYANIEAAYCKNSIVLSKVDGQGELQIDGAYWFESDNIEEFTQKLEQAIIELNLPEKVTQREFVKTQVQQIYSLQEWSNKLVDIF